MRGGGLRASDTLLCRRFAHHVSNKGGERDVVKRESVIGECSECVCEVVNIVEGEENVVGGMLI